MGTRDIEASNLRAHSRVRFFRVRTDEGFVPVYAFAPAEDPQAIAAVVMDLSEGGLQLVCNANEFVQTQLYDCALVDEHLQQYDDLGSWIVQRVWSKEEGMYLKSGFSFTVQGRVTPDVVARLEGADHHLLRCVLHPLRQID